MDDGDGADASDAGEPRLILSSHRALDAIGGFVPPTDLQALRVVSKTVSDSRVLVATIRVVTQRCTAHAASKRARRRLEAVDVMGHFLGPDAEGFLRPPAAAAAAADVLVPGATRGAGAASRPASLQLFLRGRGRQGSRR